MAQRDIIVRRVPGALTAEAPVLGTLSIPAIICRTKGRQIDASSEEGSSTPANFGADDGTFEIKLDKVNGAGDIFIGTFPIDSILRLEDSVGNVYLPSIHFRIKDGSGNYVDNVNLGITSDNVANYKLDFSQAPLLKSPIFELSVETDKGGTFTEAGTYEVRVYALGLDGKVSQAVTKTVTIANTTDNIIVSWKKVAYAKGYVLRLVNPSGNDGYIEINDNTVFSYVIDTDKDTDNNGPWTKIDENNPFPYSVGSKEIPEADNSVTLYYYTLEKIVNQPKLYSNLRDVVADHGMGSEAYNIARLMMSPEYGGAPFLYIVAVAEESTAGYLQAVQALESINNVHFIIPITLDSDVIDSLHNQAIALSDPASGQKERYVVVGVNYDWYSNDLKTFVDDHRAFSDKGKRIIIGVFDGGEISLESWVTEDEEYMTDYKLTDPFSNDITPMVGMAIAIAKYCSFRLTSESLIEKNIPGVNFKKSAWGDDVYIYLRNMGVMVIRNDSGTPVVDMDINASWGLLGVQDSQLPICRTEDWMKADLRSRLAKYRGRRYPTQLRLDVVKDNLAKILSEYVAKELIYSFDEGSINIEVYSNGQMHVYFKYTPVIIVNNILAEYEFELLL